ncbi:hypothetical protein H5410_049865 [Solanum commersonii]|uniref:Uncharacterized protein n=1 Tax=Solanum commersonii TaxID=4109 RepID=A0A9J5WWA7_SOLCO|nr:hypothetical protein H5410_049865 [Solanum commersonii]
MILNLMFISATISSGDFKNTHRTQPRRRLCFAMTINKAQGCTLDFVGIYLREPCLLSWTISMLLYQEQQVLTMLKYTINMITPTLKIGPQKVQVVDKKSHQGTNKDKTTKYQVLVLFTFNNNMKNNKITFKFYTTNQTFYKFFLRENQTYLVCFAHVKGNLREDPLPPPTRLTLTTFHTFEYQSKEFEFGRCKNKYPKEFVEQTTKGKNSYPIYRRLNT